MGIGLFFQTDIEVLEAAGRPLPQVGGIEGEEAEDRPSHAAVLQNVLGLVAAHAVRHPVDGIGVEDAEGHQGGGACTEQSRDPTIVVLADHLTPETDDTKAALVGNSTSGADFPLDGDSGASGQVVENVSDMDGAIDVRG